MILGGKRMLCNALIFSAGVATGVGLLVVVIVAFARDDSTTSYTRDFHRAR
jgi:hypothetical protein